LRARRVGDEIKLVFVLKNVGSIPVNFDKILRPRKGWDEDFQTTVTLNGKNKDRELQGGLGGVSDRSLLSFESVP
jgi:hypothetical protein